MKFSDLIWNPYAFNLAISNSCEKQSKSFYRSVNTAAKTRLLFRISDVSRSFSTVLSPKPFSKTALIFREFNYKEHINLIMYNSLIIFWNIRQNATWFVVVFLERVRFLLNWSSFCNFKNFWKFFFIQTQIKIFGNKN